MLCVVFDTLEFFHNDDLDKSNSLMTTLELMTFDRPFEFKMTLNDNS